MAKQINEKNVDLLLDKLSSDDDFRARFQANPRAAMASIGLTDADDSSVPATPLQNLASKESIRKSREDLRSEMLVALNPFVPITVDMPER